MADKTKQTFLDELKKAPQMIVSILTYGGEEDWELGMEKMKRRRFLEEDMDKLYRTVETETTQHQDTPACKDLQEWSKGLAERVKDVRHKAEKGNTSLYQATEVLKISEPFFSFVCNVMKASFTLDEASVKLLEQGQAQYRDVVHTRLGDEDERDPDELLKECFQTLRVSIESALKSKESFVSWHSTNQVASTKGDQNPRTDIKGIVSGEQNELRVIQGYCKRDLEKLVERKNELGTRTEQFKGEQLTDIQKHKVAIASIKKERAELEIRLQKLKEEENDLQSDIKKKEESTKDVDEVLKDTLEKVTDLEDRIGKLLRKADDSFEIIEKIEAVAEEILKKAEETGESMESTAKSHQTRSLSQLRRAILTEMVLRQQHLDNMKDNQEDMEETLKTTKDELMTAKKKSHKAKIAELQTKNINYSSELEKTKQEIEENTKRMTMLTQHLVDVDKTWKEFDPDVQLTQFGQQCKDFKAKYDELSPEKAAELLVISPATLS